MQRSHLTDLFFWPNGSVNERVASFYQRCPAWHTML